MVPEQAEGQPERTDRPEEPNSTTEAPGAAPETDASNGTSDSDSAQAASSEQHSPSEGETTEAVAPEAMATEAVATDAEATDAASAVAGGTRAPRNRRRKPGAKPGAKPKSVTEQLHKGRVVEVVDGMVRVEFGPKVFGTLPVTEFEVPPEVGAEHQFGWRSVDAEGVWQLDRSHERMQELWKTLEVGGRVEALAVGANSGGLELRVGPIAAFMPASQVDLAPVKDFQPFFGRTLECELLEVNRKRRRVVVSRRVILARVQDAARAEAIQKIVAGDVREGKVERLEPFGAIVDLGDGLSGLVHVSNISHQRVKHPQDVLTVGQEVRVQVLEIKQGGKRIGLGMKQLEADPWSKVAERFRVGTRHTGPVVRTSDFGAFVSLAEGIEGLVHISQLSKDRVERVNDVVKKGEEIQVRVVNLDPDRKRVGLSRLNRAGEMLGSDADSEEGDEAESAAIEQFKQPPAQRGTNLGDVLRKALEGR